MYLRPPSQMHYQPLTTGAETAIQGRLMHLRPPSQMHYQPLTTGAETAIQGRLMHLRRRPQMHYQPWTSLHSGAANAFEAAASNALPAPESPLFQGRLMLLTPSFWFG